MNIRRLVVTIQQLSDKVNGITAVIEIKSSFIINDNTSTEGNMFGIVFICILHDNSSNLLQWYIQAVYKLPSYTLSYVVATKYLLCLTNLIKYAVNLIRTTQLVLKWLATSD